MGSLIVVGRGVSPTLYAGLAGLWLAISPSSVAPAEAERGQQSGTTRAERIVSKGDVICGPRCVEFILDYYGKTSVDLVDLVRETQGDEIDRGSTMATLKNALDARGVYTYAGEIPPGGHLRWPYPAIVHLRSEDPRGMGHYVVQLASEGGTAVVYSGLSGYQRGGENDLGARMWGHVLLTSPEPISDPVVCVEVSTVPARALAWGGVAVLLVSGFVGFVSIMRLRHKHHYLQPKEDER
jgi:hypothetical protein